MFFAQNLEIRRFRTNLRRLYLASAVLFAFPEPVLFAVGAGLVSSGVLVHFWASGYLTRGKSLVSSGPYALVRNPFYSAALIIDLGFGLASRNWIALAVFLPLIAAVYLKRIFGEEKALGTAFGQEYRAYRGFCTARLVPGLFNFFRTPPGEPLRFSLPMVFKNREMGRAASHLVLLALVGTPLVFPAPWESVSLPVRGIALGALALVLAAMSVRILHNPDKPEPDGFHDSGSSGS